MNIAEVLKDALQRAAPDGLKITLHCCERAIDRNVQPEMFAQAVKEEVFKKFRQRVRELDESGHHTLFIKTGGFMLLMSRDNIHEDIMVLKTVVTKEVYTNRNIRIRGHK